MCRCARQNRYAHLRTDRTGELSYVARAIEKVAAHFSAPRADGDQLGIIGFCGAPFTLASYMIEGGSSRNYIETKKLMYSDNVAWPMLMEKLVTVLVGFAQQQVEAGADVIQIFDSWVGALSVTDYRRYCLPAATELVQRVQAHGRAGHLLRRGYRFPAARDERDRSGCDRARLARSARRRMEGRRRRLRACRAISIPSPCLPPKMY